MRRSSVLAVLIVAMLLLPACAPATPQVVEKQIVVEKPVVQTVVVEKQVEVEKKVVETVVVEKEKQVEVVVTTTPVPPTVVPQAPTEIQYGGTLNVWQPNGWPEPSWPHQSNWESRWADSLMADYLFDGTRAGAIEPALATGIEASADGLVYTMKLRPDVKWHDGQPFTADDVIYSIHLWYNPDKKPITAPGVYGSLIQGMKEYQDKTAETIAGVKIVDDLTVEFTLTTPHPSFPRVFMANRFVVPKHTLEKLDKDSLLNGTDKYWTTNPVGTGPFKFVKYVPDQYIEFDRNDTWWGGKPGVDKVFLKIASASTALVMLENGELDYVTAVSPSEIPGLRENPKIVTLQLPWETSAYGLLRNYYTMDGFWRNPKAIQAFLYSIDREGYNQSILRGEGKVVNSMFDGSIYACPTMVKYDYDPVKADQLWTELGIPKEARAKITIDFMSWLGLKARQDMLPVYQESMRKLGFASNVDFIDNSLITQYTTGDGPRGKDFDFYVLATGWGGDPFGVFGLLDPTSATNVGVYGYPFPPEADGKKHPDWIYDNPRINELKAEALKTTDPEKLKKIFQEVDCIWNQDQPALQLVSPVEYAAVSTRVQGMKFDKDKPAPLWGIGYWWLWEQK
jgi:peptide/nickel transport system substrate-binding protein